MIELDHFFKELKSQQIDFFTGVPDSLLKDFSGYLTAHPNIGTHIIAANEGLAVSLASGYHLGTGKIPLVYMQNSGIGNAINPLVSLCDSSVYSIPMLIVIGWRGELGSKDEPQHYLQGKMMPELLITLHLEFVELSPQTQNLEELMQTAFDTIRKTQKPFVILVRKNTFEKIEISEIENNLPEFELSRQDVLRFISEKVDGKSIFVTTTGKTSRELYDLRKGGSASDFLTVGSMGHASQIALGIAMSNPSKNVYCIDGDGAMLMHLGAMATIGNLKPKNLKHILINNGCHESVGGQPTVALEMDLLQLAKACGYPTVFQINNQAELEENFLQFLKNDELSFVEIKVNKTSSANLPRPLETPVENKKAFMNFLSKE